MESHFYFKTLIFKCKLEKTYQSLLKLFFSCNQIGLCTEDYNKYLKIFELKNNFLKFVLRYLEQVIQLFESHLFRFDYTWHHQVD